jgi:hypothetical protein
MGGIRRRYVDLSLRRRPAFTLLFLGALLLRFPRDVAPDKDYVAGTGVDGTTFSEGDASLLKSMAASR